MSPKSKQTNKKNLFPKSIQPISSRFTRICTYNLAWSDVWGRMCGCGHTAGPQREEQLEGGHGPAAQRAQITQIRHSGSMLQVIRLKKKKKGEGSGPCVDRDMLTFDSAIFAPKKNRRGFSPTQKHRGTSLALHFCGTTENDEAIDWFPSVLRIQQRLIVLKQAKKTVLSDRL